MIGEQLERIFKFAFFCIVILVVEVSFTRKKSHSNLFAAIDSCADSFYTYGGVCFFETSLSETRFVL